MNPIEQFEKNPKPRFRAWAKDTQEMIPFEEMMIPEWFDDPNIIILQWTGLYDKNGDEIYDGHIIEGFYLNLGTIEHLTCAVVRDGAKIHPFTESKGESTGFLDETVISSTDFEIIGNVFVQPELLNDHQSLVK